MTKVLLTMAGLGLLAANLALADHPGPNCASVCEEGTQLACSAAGKVVEVGVTRFTWCDEISPATIENAPNKGGICGQVCQNIDSPGFQGQGEGSGAVLVGGFAAAAVPDGCAGGTSNSIRDSEEYKPFRDASGFDALTTFELYPENPVSGDPKDGTKSCQERAVLGCSNANCATSSEWELGSCADSGTHNIGRDDLRADPPPSLAGKKVGDDC